MSCIDAVFSTLQSKVLRQDIIRPLRIFVDRPLSVYVSLHHILSTWLPFTSLLSAFAYCKQSKTGEGLGTGLKSTHVHSDRWVFFGLLHQDNIKLHLQTTKHASKWFIWSKLPSVRLTSANESQDDAMLEFPACWFSIKIRGVAGKWFSRRGQQVRSSGGVPPRADRSLWAVPVVVASSGARWWWCWLRFLWVGCSCG